MARVLAVANRKGGTGKTTVSLALASRLAEGGRVLLVDLDSQANATEALGIKLMPGVFVWLGAGQGAQPVYSPRRPGLDVIPGDVTTERVNLILSSEGDVGALGRALDQVGEAYQWVILDCPPSMSMLMRAAIWAADYVLCPTVPEYLSVAGVRQLVLTIAQIRERHGRPVKLLGILPNKYDRRTTEHKQNLVDLVRAYGAEGKGGYVWPPLRQSIAVARASAQGMMVWEALTGQPLLEWMAMADRVAGYA